MEMPPAVPKPGTAGGSEEFEVHIAHAAAFLRRDPQ